MEYTDKANKLFSKLQKQAQESGYLLNPDTELTMSLVEGLAVNQDRYGQPICPCRLLTGEVKESLDIVCPCDYRDDDINEYGSCFCGLYVSPEMHAKGGPTKQTPERRPSLEERTKAVEESHKAELTGLPYPVWRCKVCGYLCANNNPPKVCPICKATQERFERFL